MRFFSALEIINHFKIKKDETAIINFIKKNFKYIEPIDDIYYYNNGVFNVVFKIKGKDLVLKIGSIPSKKDLINYKKIIDLQKEGKMKSFAKIYYFEHLEQSNLFLIVCEQYKPLTIKKDNFFSRVNRYASAYLDMSSKITKERFFNQLYSVIPPNMANKELLDELLEIYWDFYSNGITSYDFHIFNVMMDKNNRLIAVDF